MYEEHSSLQEWNSKSSINQWFLATFRPELVCYQMALRRGLKQLRKWFNGHLVTDVFLPDILSAVVHPKMALQGLKCKKCTQKFSSDLGSQWKKKTPYPEKNICYIVFLMSQLPVSHAGKCLCSCWHFGQHFIISLIFCQIRLYFVYLDVHVILIVAK